MRAHLVSCFAIIILALSNPSVRASERRNVPNPTKAFDFGSLPLSFEQCGESGALSDSFCLRAPGSAVFLTPVDVTFMASRDFAKTFERRG